MSPPRIVFLGTGGALDPERYPAAFPVESGEVRPAGHRGIRPISWPRPAVTRPGQRSSSSSRWDDADGVVNGAPTMIASRRLTSRRRAIEYRVMAGPPPSQ